MLIKEEQWLAWLLQTTSPACVERTEHIFVPLHKTTHFYCPDIAPELIRYNRPKIHAANFINKSLNLDHKTPRKETLLPGITPAHQPMEENAPFY